MYPFEQPEIKGKAALIFLTITTIICGLMLLGLLIQIAYDYFKNKP